MKLRVFMGIIKMAKINKEIAQEIIDLYLEGNNYESLGKKFGLFKTTIGKIVRGNIWVNCNRPSDIMYITKKRSADKQFKRGRMYDHFNSFPLLTTFQEEIINGSLLGDGHIKRYNLSRGTNSSFSKAQCIKFKDYIDWHFEIMQPFSSSVTKYFSNYKLARINGRLERFKVPRYLSAFTFRSIHHPIFSKLRKIWYPKNRKIIPEKICLTPLTIAIWFFDDGHNSSNNRQAIISTNGFQMDEVYSISKKLLQFDINCNFRTRRSESNNKVQPFLSFSGMAYDNLINLISPFCIWDCFKYKIKWRKSSKTYSSTLAH